MITKQEADALVAKHKTFFCKHYKIKDTDVYIYNYIMSDKEAFKDPKATELRGLTITKENAKERVFLSIPKFFNVNEIPDTQVNVLKNKKIKKITEKLDGSLIQPVQIAGEIHLKTKNNFEKTQAKLAQDLLDEELEFFILDCWDNGFQPLFELTGPKNKIIVDYKENKLVLIAVRNQEGEFIDIDKFNYPHKAKTFEYNFDELIQKVKNDKGYEGYVVKFNDKNKTIVKFKTIDYIEKHSLLSESNSYKTLFKRILTEDMDDLYSILGPERVEEIQKIESVLNDYVIHFTIQITEIIKQNTKDRLSFVKKHKSHPYFSVIMSCLKGKDPKTELINTLLKRYNKEEKIKQFLKEITAI